MAATKRLSSSTAPICKTSKTAVVKRPSVQPPTKSPHFSQRPRPTTTTTTTMKPASQPRKQPTPYQRLVYAHLLCIPPGRITSYLKLSKAVAAATPIPKSSEQPKPKPSARAVGGALRNNPFAPTVPCHRVIAATGYVGGFKGEWFDAPSGVNQGEKLELLKEEGVEFDAAGKLNSGENGGGGGEWAFDGPWGFEEHVDEVERLCAGL